MTEEEKIEKAKRIIKEFRKEQGIVFEIHQEIITLQSKVYGHEMMKHYYEVTFTKMFGAGWEFKIQELEKELASLDKPDKQNWQLCIHLRKDVNKPLTVDKDI